MGKMNISKPEFKYMVECLERDLVASLVEKENMELETALDTLYSSDTYSALNDPATGLYYQSPGYVYDYLNQEMHTGKMQ